ncbi:MAG: CARDB domain-containing protein [Sedimenticolaceae bacterium]
MQINSLGTWCRTFGVALIALCVFPVPAGALNFTNECENALTQSDRQLFEDAADLVDRYRNDVEDHINDSLLFGNTDNYIFIDHGLMDDWRDEVSDMQTGDVKIACEYNGMTFNTCARNPTKLGMEGEIQPGRIHICIDNVRQNANAASGSPLALLAGVMAHELMHIVDGFMVGHNGDTDVNNPDTAAETIGVAMEHLILTPDLDTTIQALDISCCNQDGEATLTFDVLVRNMNAEADIQVSPISGSGRNGSSRLTVEVEGASDQRTISALDGSASAVQSFRFDIPALEVAGDGIRDIVADADAANVFFESDERNNSDSASVSTTVDLSLGIEVAGPPTCHSLEYRSDAPVPGYYSWMTVPFRAEVFNVDSENTAPRVDIVMTYDDMWTDSSITSQQVVWTDSIDPNGRTEATFYLDVPSDRLCAGPIGDTLAIFQADGNSETLNDANRDNNGVELIIDQDYWRPDYVIRDIAPAGLGQNTRTISFAIRNIGPRDGANGRAIPIASTRVTDVGGSTVHFSALTSNLAPGEQQVFEAALPIDDCHTLTYLVTADSLDAVDEYDESNNSAEVRLAPPAGIGLCPDVTYGGEDNHEAELAWINEHGFEVLDDKFDSLNTVEWGTDRGTNIDIGPNAPILDRLDP